MSRIFIETTIHIQRLTARPAVRSEIDNIFQNHETLTSSYVWMEFHRTIGQDYQYLADLLRQKQPRTSSQLLRDIGDGKGLFSSRRIKRLLHTVAKLLDQIKTPYFDPFEIAYLIGRERNLLLHHQFFKGINQMVNPTRCDLIQPNYTIPPGGRMSCRRETARCFLPNLIDENQMVIEQLQADLDVLAALGANTQRALAELTPDSTMAKGERNCWALGDVIITLECPPDAALWTTNLRHFKPLCDLFGRELFLPDHTIRQSKDDT